MLDSNELSGIEREVAPTAAAALDSSMVRRRRIVAFVNDDSSAQALEVGLGGMEQKLEIKRGTIQNAVRVLEKDADLNALVVDVSELDDPLAELEALARVCPPDVMVTVIGESTDIGFYRLLVNSLGVTEYLPKPLTRDAVQTLLRPHLAGNEADAEATRGGHVVAICGAQGGAGATSIAVNLALLLADITKATVALLDLHLQNGEAAVMLGVRPGPGLRMALEDPLRADTLLIERTAIEVDQRLRLLAADEAIDAELQITEAGVRHVLALLRRKFNYIVIDVPVPLPVALRPVIATARHVLVLLQAEVTGLRNARALRAMVMEVAKSNRVFTVLNRADRKGGLTRSMIETGLGSTADIVIPDLGKRMMEAVNLGVPAIRRIPALRRHLAPMVREIAGIPTARPSSWLGRLFRS
jgi:pilus assembly protein CpaE